MVFCSDDSPAVLRKPVSAIRAMLAAWENEIPEFVAEFCTSKSRDRPF